MIRRRSPHPVPVELHRRRGLRHEGVEEVRSRHSYRKAGLRKGIRVTVMAYTDINSDDPLLLAFPEAAVPTLPPQGLEDWCHRRGRVDAIDGAVRLGVGATPLSLHPCGYCSASSGRCAYQHRPLYALRQKGWFYDSSSVKAPCIHSNSSLISDAALPFGTDSDADNPDVKAWTCSIL